MPSSPGQSPACEVRRPGRARDGAHGEGRSPAQPRHQERGAGGRAAGPGPRGLGAARPAAPAAQPPAEVTRGRTRGPPPGRKTPAARKGRESRVAGTPGRPRDGTGRTGAAEGQVSAGRVAGLQEPSSVARGGKGPQELLKGLYACGGGGVAGLFASRPVQPPPPPVGLNESVALDHTPRGRGTAGFELPSRGE